MDLHCKKLGLILPLLFIAYGLFAQESVNKRVDSSYDFTNSGALVIENKYGDITFEGWDSNRIEITATIKVTHKKRENAENLLERITPNIRATQGFITVNTEIAEKSSSFFTRYFNKGNPFDFDRSNIQIDYTIHLPSRTDIEVINKFGDVILNSWNGKLKADIAHGDLWVNNDINRADITLKYGKSKAKFIEYGVIEIKNGSMSLSQSNDLRLITSGSDIKIGEIKSLEINSSKDDITVAYAKTIHGDLRFSTLKLNQLGEAADLNLKITEFSIDKIDNADAILNLAQESSEISLNISNLSFELDAALEEGLLRLPKSFRNISTKLVDERKRIREISANYGPDPKGKLSIRGVKGIILLKEL